VTNDSTRASADRAVSKQEAIDVVSATQRAAGQAGSEAVPRVAVAVGTAGPQGTTYQVESPDRLLRMLALLTEADDELREVDLPPQALTRIQRQLAAVSAEIERSVSPALADELHRLLGDRPAEPGLREVRIEYVALLGWVSGLVIGMFSQLEAARNDQQPAGRSPAELRSP
jgi:hypothetical protein